MTQEGTHTWDLYVHYYRCPKCGWIIEDRQMLEKKEIICGRCNHHFYEKTLPSQEVEWDWDNGK
jgi:DNA-directed RNA polymerase subunit RPC12/RpoP